MLTAVLFTAIHGSNLNVIDRGMVKEDVVCIYTMEYYSASKNNEIMSFVATWMDIEIIIPSEVRQRQISYDTTYM